MQARRRARRWRWAALAALLACPFAQAALQFDRSAGDEAVEGGIHRRCIGAVADGLGGGDAAGQRDGAAARNRIEYGVAGDVIDPDKARFVS